MLADRTEKYAIVRSMATGSDGHEIACHMLLTGRLDLPVGFSLQNVPNPHEWPSIPALVNFAKQGRGRNNLPPSVVLPEPSINEAGSVRPGQYAVGSACAGSLAPADGDENVRWATGPARIVSALKGPSFSTSRRLFSKRRL